MGNTLVDNIKSKIGTSDIKLVYSIINRGVRLDRNYFTCPQRLQRPT